MTDEIKKMLEPKIGFLESPFSEERSTTLAVSKEEYDRLKRGFLKLMEQRDYWIEVAPYTLEYRDMRLAQMNAKLEAAMKGEET